MKILYPNLAQLNGAGPIETDPNFPVSNLADEHLLKVWKVKADNLENQVVLHYSAPGLADSLALFGIEMEAVTIEIYADAGMTLLEQAQTLTCQSSDVFGNKKQEQIWWEFPVVENGFFRLVVHTETLKSPQIGMVCIGQARS